MPDNSSGFVDFNQYADLNQSDEQRLMEEAMQRAEAADQKSKLALGHASQEAQGRYVTQADIDADTRAGKAPRGRVGAIVGESQGLSQTASYGDYLKAKQDASNAWAQVNAKGADPRTNALRGQLSAQGGMGARAAAAEAERARREGMVSGNITSHAAGLAGQRGRESADTAAAAEAAKAQQAKESGWNAAYLNSLRNGAQGRAAAGGTQRDYVGGFNPYASSTWAQQQGAFEAQQAKNVGGSMTDQQGIWDAYTGKGSAGATGYGGPRKNPYDGMQREMQPFAPPEEEKP